MAYTDLTLDNYVIGKHAYLAEWTDELENNAIDLLRRVNKLLPLLGCTIPVINSGWRPESYNKKVGGSTKSNHITARAVDIRDTDRSLCHLLLGDTKPLVFCCLWAEHPTKTAGWLHLQSIPPRSGNRLFMP